MPGVLEPQCDLERVAFIFNPVSGTEDPKLRRARLETLARAAGLTRALRETDAERGAAPLARDAVEHGMQRVLVSGGDGSVMEAAGALAGTGAALAVVPGGTGNLLAVNLGLPGDPEAALSLALTGDARPIDVGRANGEVFLVMAGIGADARMVRDADRELKRRLGFLAYFVAAVRQLGRPRGLYTITIDGRSIRRSAHSVIIANLGRVTGGVELVRGSDPDDGLLEVAILRARTFRHLAVVAWKALSGTLRSDEMLEIRRGREILVETRRPQPVQIDGNEAGVTTRLEVHVEPGALRIVRPAPGDEVTAPLPLVLTGASRNWVPIAAAAGLLLAVAYVVRRRRAKSSENSPPSNP
jgi:diacylglycerol kinase (ATP)